MFLTRECDYGIRVVRALADNEKRTVKTICEMENIPQQYAYKILKKLENAGIVKSSRGPDGGYHLVKSPTSFSIFDIITAVDENLFLNECLKEGQECSRNTEDAPCAVHFELERIQNMLIEELKCKNMLEIMDS